MWIVNFHITQLVLFLRFLSLRINCSAKMNLNASSIWKGRTKFSRLETEDVTRFFRNLSHFHPNMDAGYSSEALLPTY